ncbi:J-kappa-recombination signal binding protein [Mycena venus]|uniref:J-kappa-recombination signal binding protein n=1 Tax=Mycena venus TaxID=2733690 RepID=A0A8H7D7H1_9AGAR|nr:J-kappa-recombination signal binding protein [Mycena venus]
MQNTSSRSSNDLSRWDLADILNPSSAPPRIDPARERKMSLDFPHHHGMYAQSDLDSGFNAHPDGNGNHHQLPPTHPFENPEGHAFGSGYRTNASSSSSLGPPRYGLNSDGMYHSSFGDASYQSNGNPYGDIGSYNSGGKVSPLTPTDPVGGIHHPSPFANKDYPPNYPDLSNDRRMPNGNYPSEFPSEDYPINPPFTSGNTLPHFQDRRFSPDTRFNHSGHLPPPSNHLSGGHGSDIMRSVAPGATHSGYRHEPYLEQYIRTPNRLAFGERTVIVMSSKVAQKSYGTEKRFLCPPPTAIMIGNSWWTEVVRRGDEPKLCPPRVVISISGEPTPQEGSIEWTGSSGKSFDVSDPPTGTTYTGRCVGKQLFISDVDEKKKKVEALVKITAPATDDEPERVIGTFPSRPIKVISKPSKKRQSAKNLELCINHGSTISLFHRLRSQTVSTKYLCVSGSGSSFKGSDGAPLMGLDQRARSTTPSFIARTASWDPFVMYIVDPDYPSPPPNAIPFSNNGSQIPIYYNQTVVLQCLTSGVVSPVLIIRKVDHQTTVVGGGLQEGAKGVADHYCAPAEVCGDPVSQLHKIAFEVYDGARAMPEPGTPGTSGAFLSCMGEKVNTYRPIDGRQWNGASAGAGSNSPTMPGSPISGSSGGAEYFHGSTGSAPTSPSASPDFLSNDGGRVKKKRGSTSAGGMSAGITKNVPKGRRRPSSAGSVTSTRRGSGSDSGVSSGALWQVDIGETSVWTIVGTDQVRYNFYIPPVLFDNQNAPGAFPVPTKPITPFPALVKYLPARPRGGGAEAPLTGRAVCAVEAEPARVEDAHRLWGKLLQDGPGERVLRRGPVAVRRGAVQRGAGVPPARHADDEAPAAHPDSVGRRGVPVECVLSVIVDVCMVLLAALASLSFSGLRVSTSYSSLRACLLLYSVLPAPCCVQLRYIPTIKAVPPPSPSPSRRMDLSSSSLSISSMPKMLWTLYIDYLWNWTDHPNSWVSRIAYTSRVLAILLIMPIVVLTLLDLASYGIARTLGVIDDVKASTSDKETIHNKIPLVRVQRAPGTPSPDSASLLASTDSETLLDASERLQQQHPHSKEPNSSFDFSSSADTLPRLGINTTVPSVSHPDAYFTSGDHSLKLSGVGVFSPCRIEASVSHDYAKTLAAVRGQVDRRGRGRGNHD